MGNDQKNCKKKVVSVLRRILPDLSYPPPPPLPFLYVITRSLSNGRLTSNDHDVPKLFRIASVSVDHLVCVCVCVCGSVSIQEQVNERQKS